VACLESRAAAVAGVFNPQHIANTLWAYATLGIQPGAGLVACLERRAAAVVGEFNPQDIANTLWAYASMNLCPGHDFLSVLIHGAHKCLWSQLFDTEHVVQLHQYMLTHRLQGWEDGQSLAIVESLAMEMGNMGLEALSSQQPIEDMSHLQCIVAAAVKRVYKGNVIDEYVCPVSGYSIDIHIPPVDGSPAGASGIAIEVNGPYHYLVDRSYRRTHSANGATILKRRLLERIGHTVLTVPYWEWDALGSDNDRDEYIRHALSVLGL